jgi:hypothetical protein
MKRAGDLDRETTLKNSVSHRQVFHRFHQLSTHTIWQETLLERNRSTIYSNNMTIIAPLAPPQQDNGDFTFKPIQVRSKRDEISENIYCRCASRGNGSILLPCMYLSLQLPNPSMKPAICEQCFHCASDRKIEGSNAMVTRKSGCTCCIYRPIFRPVLEAKQHFSQVFSHFLFAFLTNRDGNGWQPRCKPFNKSPWGE